MCLRTELPEYRSSRCGVRHGHSKQLSRRAVVWDGNEVPDRRTLHRWWLRDGLHARMLYQPRNSGVRIANTERL